METIGDDRRGSTPPTIYITGVPGVGKTTLAQSLSRLLGMPIHNPGEVAKARGWGHWAGEEFVVDLARVCDYIQKARGIVESHLICECRVPWALVIRAPPLMLWRRLTARGYGPWKLDENISAEMIDYCGERLRENSARVFYLDGRLPPEKLTSQALRAIRERRSFKTWADEPTQYLEEYFRLKHQTKP